MFDGKFGEKSANHNNEFELNDLGKCEKIFLIKNYFNNKANFQLSLYMVCPANTITPIYGLHLYANSGKTYLQISKYKDMACMFSPSYYQNYKDMEKHEIFDNYCFNKSFKDENEIEKQFVREQFENAK